MWETVCRAPETCLNYVTRGEKDIYLLITDISFVSLFCYNRGFANGYATRKGVPRNFLRGERHVNCSSR